MKSTYYTYLALVVSFAIGLAGLAFVYSDEALAYAETIGSTTDENDLTYDLYDDNTAILIDSAKLIGDVVVPAEVIYEGTNYSVTSAETFNGNKNITSIIFENPSFTMADSMFKNCSNLTSVTMNITVVTGYAFDGCSKMITADFGTNVKTIGAYAFRNCNSLTDLTIGTSVESIEDRAFFNTTNLSIELVFTNLNTIGGYAFNQSGITKFNADGVTNIGTRAFDRCSSLAEVTLKGTFTEIPNYTFYTTTSTATVLSKITLDGNVGSIGNFSFQGCSALTDLSITGTVTSIGNSAFDNCSSLKTLGFDISKVVDLKASVFKGCTSLDAVYSGTKLIFIPFEEDFKVRDGTTEIVANAASNNTILRSIEIPDSVTEIGSYAFDGCTALETVDLPETAAVGTYAFSGCIGLTDFITGSGGKILLGSPNWEDLVVPEGIEVIDSGSISGDNVKTVTMSSSVKTINISGFRNCAMESIVLSDDLQVLDDRAFDGCKNLKEVTIPASLTYLSNSLFNSCESLENVNIHDSVTHFGQSVFSNCKALKEFTIGPAVTNMGARVFQNSGVENVIIAAQLDALPDYTFYGCDSLKVVEFPATVTAIGTYAFNGCSELTDVDLINVVSIGNSAFRSCEKLAEVDLQNATSIGQFAFNSCGLISVDLSKVETIGNQAFRNCKSLITVDFPSNLKVIPSYAFAGCTSLSSITFRSDYTEIQANAFRDVTHIDDMEIYGMLDLMSGHRLPGEVTRLVVHTAAPINNPAFDAFATSSAKDDDGNVTVPVTRMIDGNPVTGKLLIKGFDAEALRLDSSTVAINFNLLIGDSLDIVEPNGHFTVHGTPDNDSGNFSVYSYNHLLVEYSEEITVIEGTKTINPMAIRSDKITFLSLPSTLTGIPYKVADLPMNDLEAIYLRSNIVFNSDNLLSATPDIYVSGEVEGELVCEYVDGRFINHTKGDVFLFLNDSHVNMIFSIDEDGITFDIKPYHDYNKSALVVKIGETELVPDVDGRYNLEVTKDTEVYITGITLNTFNIALPDDAIGYEIIISPGSEDIDVNTKVLLSVGILPGYNAEEDFKVTLNDIELTSKYFREGYYFYEFILLEDSVINVIGIVLEGTTTITFESNGGSDVGLQTIPTGSRATYMTPTYDGYEFMGWFVDTELESLYDFDAPVTNNMTLYAKWTPSAGDKFAITFKSDKATFVVMAYGNTPINTGDQVYKGAIVKFIVTAPLNYDIHKWIINGVETVTFENEMTVTIDADTTVSVECEYRVNSTFVNVNEVPSPIPGHHVHLWTFGEGTSGGSGLWTGMVYAPAVYGDFIYTKMDNVLVKIDIDTGELIKSVETSNLSPSFYQKVAVGNNMIFDGPTGKVYDLDLNHLFTTKHSNIQPYYHDGMFYVDIGPTTYCFAAEDMDPSVPDNVQEPLWSKTTDVSQVYTGAPTRLFGDGWFVVPTATGDDRHLSVFSTQNGEMIDRLVIPEFIKAAYNTGYIDLNEGYVTLTVYGSGIFDAPGGNMYNIAAIKIGDDGHFDRTSLKIISSNAGNSYHSSLIVKNGYGFVNASGIFQVYNMDTMELIAEDDKYKGTAIAHGNMAISTGYSDKIYGYVVPYNSNTSLYGFEFDTQTEKLTAVEYPNSASQAQYASSQVHFTADGKIIYVNDSGKLFCVSYANDVKVIYSEEKTLTQTVARGHTLVVDPSVDKYYTDEALTEVFDPTVPITNEMTLYVTLRDWYVDNGVFRYVKTGEMPDYAGTTIPWAGEEFTSVVIGEDVTSIGAYAFFAFEGIESATISASVLSIGDRAFYGCVGLSSIIFEGDVPTIGDKTFFGCSSLEYTISYISDGSIYAKDTLGYGEKIFAPDMVKEGYTFAGWDIEIPETMSFNDIVAIASWTINEYTITWSIDGEVTTSQVDYGQTPEFSGSIDKAEDDQYTYIFTGWDPEIAPATGDITYTAQYAKELNEYTITWKWTTEEGVQSLTESMKYGTTPSKDIPGYNTVDKAYTFTIWSPMIVPVAGDAEYIAIYDDAPRKYEITFDANGVTGEVPATITADYNSVVKLPEAGGLAKAGHYFAGWSLIKDGEVIDSPYTLEENVTLYAIWNIDQYAIVFNANGATGEAPATIIADYNSEATLPEADDLSMTGYTFAGWSETADGAVITGLYNMPLDGKTLYAIWIVNTYTVAFDTIGGSALGPITQDYGTEVELPTEVAKAGHTFGGWSLIKDGEVIETLVLKEDVKLYALWEIAVYDKLPSNEDISEIISQNDKPQLQMTENLKDEMIDKSLFEGLGKKPLTIDVVDDKEQVQYSWTFEGEYKPNAGTFKAGISQMEPEGDLRNALTKKGAENPLVLKFAASGELPIDATVKYYVGENYEDGTELTLFYYNADTKQLEEKAKDIVVTDGWVTLSITHCSSYILTDEIVPVSDSEDNTLLYLGIGISALILVAVAFFIMRRQ